MKEYKYKGKKLTFEQQELVMQNLKLVYRTYLSMFSNPLPLYESWKEDLIQEGMIGLCQAARAYNPEYKTAFSTLAIPCIRHSIGMLVRKIKNDFMVDSMEEVITEDEEGNGNVYTNILSSLELSPEEIYEMKEEKDLILSILTGAPEITRFIFKQILLNNRKAVDIWIEYYPTVSQGYINNIISRGRNKIKKIIDALENINLPKQEDYISHQAYKEDMKRLWKSTKPSIFKPTEKYLKRAD